MSDVWRVGEHYGIHVYCGEVPVATFHTVADAKRAVDAVNDAVAAMATIHKRTADPCVMYDGICYRASHRVRAVPTEPTGGTE